MPDNFMRSLYILDANPLLDEYLTKIFSHSADHLFTLLIASFDMQKLLNLMQLSLFS
jgi:hypothetical protein